MNTQRKLLTRGLTLPAKALGALLIGCTLCSCDEHELTPQQRSAAMAAYKPWSKKLVPTEGMSINPTLGKYGDAPTPIQLEINIIK